MMGDPDRTARYRERTLAIHPDFSVAEWMRVMPQRDPAHRDQYETALRKAGFS